MGFDRNIKAVLCAVVCLAAGAIPLLSPEAGPPPGPPRIETREECAALYEKHAKEIETSSEPRIRGLMEQYIRLLTDMENALTQKGDLDGVVVVRNERTRAEKERRLPDNTPANLPPPIQEAQANCRKAIAAVPDEKCLRLADLTRHYIDRLSVIQKNLVVENNLDEATKVRSEIKRVTFLMEEALSRIEPPSPPPEKPSSITPASPSPSKPCSVCNGKKIITEDCPVCKGSGTCPGCSGGYETKGGKKTSIPHALCRGTGKCAKCRGTGKIKTPCPACAGL